MIEKIKAVNNPLTIIAIFAGLAEIAGTVALATVNKELQHVFVWFVMVFPTLIVVLFFLTLNFNPKVLYAPSDFRDEANFLNTLIGTRELSVDLAELVKQLDHAKDEILNQTVQEISSAGQSERARLVSVVNRQIELLQARVESTRLAADVVADAASAALPQAGPFPQSSMQAKILSFLAESGEPRSVKAIAEHVNSSNLPTRRALSRLLHRGLIAGLDAGSDGSYVLTRLGTASTPDNDAA